jgi:hypothetical protein
MIAFVLFFITHTYKTQKQSNADAIKRAPANRERLNSRVCDR